MSAQPIEDGTHAKASTRNSRPARTLLELEALPDSALINEVENCLVLNICRTTNWRGIKAGILPSPIRLGPRMKRFNLGRARQCARGDDWK